MNWKALRIAVIGPLPPPAGGMAGQTEQLAGLLRGEGAEIIVVQTNAPYSPHWIERIRGVRAAFRLIRYLPRLWTAAGRVDIFHVMANSGWSWHLFAAPAIVIGRLRRVEVVVNYRGGEALTFLQKSVRSVRPIVKLASAVIVPSGFLENIFDRFGIRTQIVPNVVDLARFRPRVSSSGAVPDRVILVARNLEPIYRIDTAIAALARIRSHLPDVRLIIAGSGSEEANLKQLALSLGVAEAVEFTGRLGRDEMAARYRDASVALNPSGVDNMPNSVLEAMATGVPIVSTNVGGVPFIVDHERSALLVPVGDHEAMAAAVVRVLQDRTLAARLVAAASMDVQRFSWVSVRNILGRVYDSLHALPASRTNPV